jgi:hypothetical protein
MHIKYVSVTEGFNGHRFCEAGHSFEDQWYSDQVYIWNLQYFNNNQEVTGTVISSDKDSDGHQVLWMQWPFTNQSMADFDTGLSEQSGSGGGNEISNGWRLRPFHPKANGHTVIKNSVIAQLKADKVPGVRS